MSRSSGGDVPSTTAATSDHRSGAATVGRSRARNENGAAVVLCTVFWLQSMKILPPALLLGHLGRQPVRTSDFEDCVMAATEAARDDRRHLASFVDADRRSQPPYAVRRRVWLASSVRSLRTRSAIGGC